MLPFSLPSEGITHFEDSRVDTGIRGATTAGVGEMMVTIFQLAGAGMSAINFHPGPDFKS